MNKFDSSAYLSSLNIDVMRMGLGAITELLLQLGNPRNSYKTILIAGTNGKGSTAAMIASILHSSGYKVGLYTSPHLIDVRERIVINGEKIPWKAFNQIIADVKDKMKQPLTYFEFLTAVAFVYFQRQQVDIAVLEVGLGGRLDATNVCQPLVSVITNIAFDHTAYLGNSLEAIAREKAGIIKQNGACITAVKQKSVLKIIKNICLRRKAKLYCLGSDIKIKRQRDGFFTYQGLYRNLYNLTIPLRGEHQLSNAALALAAIEFSEKTGFKFNDAAIHTGLKNTHWEARLEILQNNPLFLIDGAHNPAGINVLCQALKNIFLYRRLILIFGALDDKDYKRMLKKIVPLAPKIILTKLQTKRAAPVDDMWKIVAKMGYSAIVTEDVDQAIGLAQTIAGEKDLICATGSFYLVGEVKRAFSEIVSYDRNNLQSRVC